MSSFALVEQSSTFRGLCSECYLFVELRGLSFPRNV